MGPLVSRVTVALLWPPLCPFLALYAIRFHVPPVPASLCVEGYQFSSAAGVISPPAGGSLSFQPHQVRTS